MNNFFSVSVSFNSFNLVADLTNEQFVFDTLDSEFLSTKIKEINRVKVCLATLVFELNTFKLAGKPSRRVWTCFKILIKNSLF